MSRLGARLRRHARKQPDARAVYAGERWWTYGELVAEARLHGEELGVTAGDVVAIVMSRGIAAVIAVCAAALADAVPAVIDADDAELAGKTLATLRPARVIGGELGAWEPIARPGLAFVIFTSGSTADAKGVAWSETRAGYDWRSEPPTKLQRAAPSGIAVPLCTALGLQDVLRVLHDGLACVLLDVPFQAGLEQARALGVNRMRLTPTHVDVLLATTIELPALRRVVVASAPIAPDKLRALAARLPGAQIGRTYGLTESGAATMIWLDKHPKRMRTVGRAIAYRRITVRDADGNVLPPKTWGEVVIEMPAWNRGDGYLDAQPELAARFANATLRTGDRGKLDGRGFLVLGARRAEILKVGGRSVSAPHIEDALRGAAGVTELAVIGVPDRAFGQVPCAVFVPAAGARPAELLAAGTALRPDETPRWLLPRWALPRGASGKLRRGRLAVEAKRWVAAFPQRVAPDHRTYPAYALDPRASVVDAGVAPWFPAPTRAAGRVVALVAKSSSDLLAFGYLQAGAPGVGGARFVLGPIAAAADVAEDLLDVFAGELLRLVALLPGAPVKRVYTQRQYDGFAAAGGEAEGWFVRGEVIAAADAVAAALRI
jgi:acyl-CoA synthetase (AMP-forming)/AMP-acid ligase II